MAVKKIMGVVSSVKSSKTVCVKVERIVQHPKYRKLLKRHSKYMAHDPESVCKQGDWVWIQECRPVSKLKAWVVNNIVED